MENKVVEHERFLKFFDDLDIKTNTLTGDTKKAVDEIKQNVIKEKGMKNITIADAISIVEKTIEVVGDKILNAEEKEEYEEIIKSDVVKALKQSEVTLGDFIKQHKLDGHEHTGNDSDITKSLEESKENLKDVKEELKTKSETAKDETNKSSTTSSGSSSSSSDSSDLIMVAGAVVGTVVVGYGLWKLYEYIRDSEHDFIPAARVELDDLANEAEEFIKNGFTNDSWF